MPDAAGACRAGWSSLRTGAVGCRTVSLSRKRSPGISATTLMACGTLFKADAAYGIVPSAEFDGDPETVVREYDPWDA